MRPEQAAIWHTRTGETLCCPIAEPGDVLWVRETWGFNPDFPGIAAHACYRADRGHEHDGIRWRPSIHMPRATCRLRLAVTGVRVERLQDISDADVVAEGAIAENGATPRGAFASLWDSAYGAGAWDVDPWVWVVEFERV